MATDVRKRLALFQVQGPAHFIEVDLVAPPDRRPFLALVYAHREGDGGVFRDREIHLQIEHLATLITAFQEAQALAGGRAI